MTFLNDEFKISLRYLKRLSFMQFTLHEILVILACVQKLDSANCLVPSLEAVSEALCVSKRSVMATIKKLKDLGLIAKDQHRFDFTDLTRMLQNFDKHIDNLTPEGYTK